MRNVVDFESECLAARKIDPQFLHFKLTEVMNVGRRVSIHLESSLYVVISLKPRMTELESCMIISGHEGGTVSRSRD